MAIQLPVRIERDPDRIEVHIRDASNRVIAAGLIGIDAQEIVDALNARAAPRSQAKKQRIEEQLRDSDLTGQDRTDIIYGHHDSLPQCGEHVVRLGKRKVE